MLRSISFKKFLEWQAYSDLEPFDEKRQDIRTAVVVATLANQWRGKGQRAVKIQNVLNDLLKFGDDVPFGEAKQSVQEQKNIGRMMAALYNMQAEEEAAKERKRQALRERQEERKRVAEEVKKKAKAKGGQR